MNKHVIHYSFGITSAVTASLVIKEKGKENTILLFHDTKEEANDCYRFGREVAAYLGMSITEKSDGRSVTQLFKDEKYLGNNRNTPCSRVLKQEQGNRYVKEFIECGYDVTIYEGMTSPDDNHRLTGRRAAFADLGADVRFPLIEQHLSKDDCKRIVIECWGIRLSDSYNHFEHDNCLNRGCVKGGLAYYGLLYLYKHEAWKKAAAEEEEFGHSILSSERYGAFPKSSLRMLQQRSIIAAHNWEARRAQGDLLPLMVQPCVCL